MENDTETIEYPNFSEWIIAISKGQEKNGRVFVSVVADTKNTYMANGLLAPTTSIYGIVSVEEWDRLVAGRYAYTSRKTNSTGSVFYHRWLSDLVVFYNDYYSKEGMLKKRRSKGESEAEDLGIDGATMEELIGVSNLEKDGSKKLASEKFKELIDKGKYDTSVLQEWLNKTSDVEELFNRTKVIEGALGAGEYENKTLIVKLIREIEGTFSISISKRLGYGLLGAVGLGRLDPATYISYRYKVKNLYDALDRDGLKGMSKIGKRMLQAHNPLLQNRGLYRLSKVGQATKQLTKEKHNVIKQGTVDYDKQILKYHQQVIKKEKSGIIKQNSLKLVKTSDGDLRWVGSRKAKQITELGIKKAEEMEAVEDTLNVLAFIPEIRPFAKAFQFILNVSLFKGLKSKKKDD